MLIQLLVVAADVVHCFLIIAPLFCTPFLRSTSGLLYFIVGFFSTLSLAQIPFTILDRGIAQKEVRNHLFHPAFNHASQALTS